MVDHVVYLLTSIVTIMKHNCSTQATSGQIPGEVTTGFEMFTLILSLKTVCNEKTQWSTQPYVVDEDRS